jgi:hypothetical protein
VNFYLIPCINLTNFWGNILFWWVFTYIYAWKRGHPFVVLYVRETKIKAYISLYSVRELSYEQNKSYPGKNSLPSRNSTLISAVCTKRGTGTGWRHVGVKCEFWDITKNWWCYKVMIEDSSLLVNIAVSTGLKLQTSGPACCVNFGLPGKCRQ